MTRRQIDASRERRLWISQIIMPALTLAVTSMGIPEVREFVKETTRKVRYKLADILSK